jgi:hypothetical protein
VPLVPARLDAREPAAHVSEALEQVVRDRGGVHGHEGRGAATAARVDGARDELLSDARVVQPLRSAHHRRSSMAPATIMRNYSRSHGFVTY